MADQMTRLLVGSIYQGSSPSRYTPAPESPTRTQLIVKLTTDRLTTWNSEQVKAIDALLTTLEWHRPWQIWQQVYEPAHIGDRYLGVGCRTCNWRAAADCPTVLAIAETYGITPEPWITGRPDEVTAPPSGLEATSRAVVVQVLEEAITSRAVTIGDPAQRAELITAAAEKTSRMFTAFLSENR